MKDLARVSLCLLLLTTASLASAHCQIPCGIYGDEARFESISEHLQTIEKSMKQITASDIPVNQTVRWVANKETHCQELQDILTGYFLAQRIKPETDEAGREGYLKSLELLHRMHVRAMKCKQTTDLEHVEKLRELAAEFKAHYFKHD